MRGKGFMSIAPEGLHMGGNKVPSPGKFWVGQPSKWAVSGIFRGRVNILLPRSPGSQPDGAA